MASAPAPSSSSSSPAAGGSSSSPAQAPGTGGGGGGGVPYHRSRFGDTTLTKVFVGGLAWETASAGLHDHFRDYGEILEAVVITDRDTGRSKGYGFVTFRDPESARQAVQDPNPMIAGRRANCNIASMGPPRPSPSPQRGGRTQRGPHLPDQQPPGPPAYVGGGRMQSQHGHQQMPTQPQAMFYHPSQYGYWYPPDYPYNQAYYNPQVQQYFSQLYGQTSPSSTPYPYLGYMPSGQNPRASGFSLMQQAGRPPFFQQPMAQQSEGSFQSAPSLPPNFRLQLPARAISRQSDDVSDSQPTQTISATEATSEDNHEVSTAVETSNSDQNTSN
ncbi:uncharacterized protein [Lolium perenne]|uniref:uncharacterized protein n=1 Tax=Lolium perenne TaxID=4522 RepID=UPI0021F5759A|nr:probable RNA-binding protein ARP1 [Lolium perenne]